MYSYCSLHKDPKLLHISIKNTTKGNFNLPCSCNICASNTYDPQMPHICNIPKLPDVHLWRKYAQIYATYEAAPIILVARITLQR